MNISAVIPAYNAAQYIEKAVLSLVNQTFPVQEIIIVDDGSTDQTVEVIHELIKKYPVIQLYQQKNAGASAARNTGISTAKGEWILLLDADDECEPTLIEHYKEKIENENYVAIYSEFVQIDETGQKISDAFSGYELLGHEGFCQMFLRNPIISPSASIILKSAYDQLGGFDISIKYVEDVDFWLRTLLGGMNIGYVSLPLSLIRRHLHNTTANIESTRQGEKRLLDKFGLSLLKDMLYARNYAVEENHLDYLQFLTRFEKWDEAKELLASLNITPAYDRYNTYLFIKALVALHFEQFTLAQNIYLEIISCDQSHGAALNNTGVIYAMNGDVHKAREAFQAALKQFPEYMDASLNLEALEDKDMRYRFTKRELRRNLLRYS